MKVHTATEHNELLNIHQAAEFLQVSPVSLRRWTDAGRLKCYRLGGRRERRFRRQDLQAFLDSYRSQDATSATRTSENAGGQFAPAMLHGMSVAYGSHLCSLYDSDQGRLKLAVPFLSEGLERGDICHFVASAPVVEKVVKALKEVTGDVDAKLGNGQLRISEGEDTAADIYHFFETELFQATQTGFRCVRVLGDMAWFLDRELTVDDLIDFELKYNHNLAHQYPVISICQFDARRFDGLGIMNALKCHEDTFAYPFLRFIGT